MAYSHECILWPISSDKLFTDFAIQKHFHIPGFGRYRQHWVKGFGFYETFVMDSSVYARSRLSVNDGQLDRPDHTHYSVCHSRSVTYRNCSWALVRIDSVVVG